MADTAASVSEFRVGSVLGRSFAILFSNIVPFGLLSLLVTLPFMFFDLQTNDEFASADIAVTGLLAIVLYLLLNSLVTATLVYGTFQDLRGRRASLSACIRRGLALIFPILGVAIISTLAMFAGFFALVVPGLIIATMLWVVIPVAVVERPGVIASLQRSAVLTKGYRWPIFGIIVLMGLIQAVADIIVELALSGTDNLVVIVLVALASTAFFTALWAVVSAVGYHDLRVVKEGVDVEQIAAVFD